MCGENAESLRSELGISAWKFARLSHHELRIFDLVKSPNFDLVKCLREIGSDLAILGSDLVARFERVKNERKFILLSFDLTVLDDCPN